MRLVSLLVVLTGFLNSISAQTTDEEKRIAKVKKRSTELFEKNKSRLNRNETAIFKATVINTNFVVPILRFNTVTKTGADNNQIGNISFFNSIGAGIGLNLGRLEITTDNNTKIVSREMYNTIGIQLGFLFASNTSSDSKTNIFAPTFSVTALNFQIGLGYELGTVGEKENRTFFTIAYGLPVMKLVNGGFYVLRRWRLPPNPKSGFLHL